MDDEFHSSRSSSLLAIRHQIKLGAVESSLSSGQQMSWDSFESDAVPLDGVLSQPTSASNTQHLSMMRNVNPKLFTSVVKYFEGLDNQSAQLEAALEALSEAMWTNERVQPISDLVLVGLRLYQHWGFGLRPAWSKVIHFITGAKAVDVRLSQDPGCRRYITVWCLPPAMQPKVPRVFASFDVFPAIQRTVLERANAAKTRNLRRQKILCTAACTVITAKGHSPVASTSLACQLPQRRVKMTL